MTYLTIKQYTKAWMCMMIVGSVLIGCTDRVSVAAAKMQDIQAQPAQEVEPPPQPKPIEDYNYAAKDIRSPFIPRSLLEAKAKIAELPAIKPDESRVKQPLEEYELSALVYRGKVIAPNGRQYGLVQAPDGTIRDVQVGEYMGKNHGRIVEITSTQVNLIEIVEDTRLGYVEKAAHLSSPN